MTNTLRDLAKRVYTLLLGTSYTISTAESCTGGMLGGILTGISGISEVYNYGFITYSDKAKTDILNVPAETIKQLGAVSKETAELMAIGALKKAQSNVAISITGIAGPNSDESRKEVGLVYFGLAKGDNVIKTYKYNFKGSRSEIREKSCKQALLIIIDNIE